MEKFKKYAPHFILIVFMTIFAAIRGTVTKEWIGIVILIIGIILLFAFIETSRTKRIKKWNSNRPGKLIQMLKFSIFLGLPISAIIIYIIHNKATLFYSILFIAIPLTVIFGWIGLIDWQKCDKMFLEEKYKVNLPN